MVIHHADSEPHRSKGLTIEKPWAQTAELPKPELTSASGWEDVSGKTDMATSTSI